MIPWETLGTAPTASGEVQLRRRGPDIALACDGRELMSSRVHASEDALGARGCASLRDRPGAAVLVGGLGLGFTLRAALDVLPVDARVQVVEVVPAMLDWHRAWLGPLTGHALEDPRVTVATGDVRVVMAGAERAWDAMLLDVDNGPTALSQPSNEGLYTVQGVQAARRALRHGGTLAVWSAGEDHGFTGRLKQAGFDVRVERVRERAGAGRRHVLWLAVRAGAVEPCRPARDPGSCPSKDHRRNR